MDELTTSAENTWCPGCGNFGIFEAFKNAVAMLDQKGIPKSNIIFTAGIGQFGKIFDYLSLSSFYGLHGRGSATAQGIKIGNPDLKVVAFGGDGDSMGEGLSHVLFAAKRNADITLILHNNGVYGLTTGQFSPLAREGYKGPSTPGGSFEQPFEPIPLILEAGATFAARGFPGQKDHLSDLIVKAVMHEGFSFIEVLQSCVTYNNTFKECRERTVIMDSVPETKEEAVAMAKHPENIFLGVFYQRDMQPYHKSLYGKWNPVVQKMARSERIEKVKGIVNENS